MKFNFVHRKTLSVGSLVPGVSPDCFACCLCIAVGNDVNTLAMTMSRVHTWVRGTSRESNKQQQQQQQQQQQKPPRLADVSFTGTKNLRDCHTPAAALLPIFLPFFTYSCAWWLRYPHLLSDEDSGASQEKKIKKTEKGAQLFSLCELVIWQVVLYDSHFFFFTIFHRNTLSPQKFPRAPRKWLVPGTTKHSSRPITFSIKYNYVKLNYH